MKRIVTLFLSLVLLLSCLCAPASALFDPSLFYEVQARSAYVVNTDTNIIVYDKADYLVSGGSGIDFMVSDDKNLTLDSLLSNTGSDKPLVSGIEVLLKGDAALSLTSIQDLADRYGITLGTNADGQETLTLDMSKWNESISADGTHVFTSTDNDLTLETNLQHDAASSSDNGEMAQQVFILENTNS